MAKKTKAKKSSKKFRCAKCKKLKLKSQGRFIYGGLAFCCKKCCNSKKKNKEACDFC